jgi:hypothetical protein
MDLNVHFQRICLLLIGFCSVCFYSGCGSINSHERKPTEAEAKAEKERTERTTRCSEEKERLKLLDSKNEEYSRLPKRVQLTGEPYIKGKLVVLELSEKYKFFTSYGGSCLASEECKPDAGCSGDDKFEDIRARSVEEVQTIALIACHKVKRGDYVQTSGSKPGERIPGYDMACNLTLVDRAIPAVIQKKAFSSELLAWEDQSRLALGTDVKELVARTPYSEMDAFLLGLPRK